jgi:hypothetical protein
MLTGLLCLNFMLHAAQLAAKIVAKRTAYLMQIVLQMLLSATTLAGPASCLNTNRKRNILKKDFYCSSETSIVHFLILPRRNMWTTLPFDFGSIKFIRTRTSFRFLDKINYENRFLHLPHAELLPLSSLVKA